MKIEQIVRQKTDYPINDAVKDFFLTWDDGDYYDEGLSILNEYIGYFFEEIEHTEEERKKVEKAIFKDINDCVTEYWNNLSEIERWLDEKLREDSQHDIRLKPFNGKDLLNIIKAKLEGHEDQKALLNKLINEY